MMRFLSVALLFVGLVAWALPPYDPPNILATVTRVVDGVSFDARIDRVTGTAPIEAVSGATLRVRLLGLEATDGPTALELVRILVAERSVYLELDRQTFDRENNLLAYVYLDAKGELMVNLILVATQAFRARDVTALRYATQIAYADAIPPAATFPTCEPAVPWNQARGRVGERLCVEGPVVSVGTSAGGDVFLNLGLAYPDPGRFTLFIPARAVGRFEAAFGSKFWTGLRGRTVRAMGEVKLYQGVPEIVLEDPANLLLP